MDKSIKNPKIPMSSKKMTKKTISTSAKEKTTKIKSNSSPLARKPAATAKKAGDVITLDTREEARKKRHFRTISKKKKMN